jgi:hypothetical protein
MEHIVNSETEGIDWVRYSAYVESIRDRLPDHIYSFASSPGYFDLTSPTTLHDAWLESLTIREVTDREDPDTRRMEISLVLLGRFGDRRIHLQYSGVMRYCLSAPPRYGDPGFKHRPHGDLLTHEIRLGCVGLFVHELLFEHDATFLIECSDIRHSEELVGKRSRIL